MGFPCRISMGIAALLMPPDTELVCRGADDVGIAVAVHVNHIHLCAILPKLRRMKYPVGLLRVCRGLPTSLFDNHIATPIAVDIAETKPMREDVRTWHFFTADGISRPCGIPLFRGATKPNHFARSRIAT